MNHATRFKIGWFHEKKFSFFIHLVQFNVSYLENIHFWLACINTNAIAIDNSGCDLKSPKIVETKSISGKKKSAFFCNVFVFLWIDKYRLCNAFLDFVSQMFHNDCANHCYMAKSARVQWNECKHWQEFKLDGKKGTDNRSRYAMRESRERNEGVHTAHTKEIINIKVNTMNKNITKSK